MKRSVPGFLVALASAALLGGCATGPVSYDVRGEADPVLNRDVNGESLSVVVRLYQLKQPGEFSKLTFDMAASGRLESELLGQDLIEKSELVVVPGSQHASTEKLSPEANYLGVVALFRQPDPHLWRYLVSANQVRSKGLIFRLHDCHITLVDSKPEPIPGQRLDAKVECPDSTVASQGPKGQTASGAAPVQPAAAIETPKLQKKKTPAAKRAYPTASKPAKDIGTTLPPAPTPIPKAAAILLPANPAPIPPANVPNQAGNVQFLR